MLLDKTDHAGVDKIRSKIVQKICKAKVQCSKYTGPFYMVMLVSNVTLSGPFFPSPFLFFKLFQK